MPALAGVPSVLQQSAQHRGLAKEGTQMNASRRRWTSPLLTATLAASAVAAAACGSGAAPAVGAPPASRHATAERAATLNWLAQTNQMWEKDDFSGLDQVTTGEARSAYLAQINANTTDPGPSGRGPLFQLTSVSITVPCHTGPASTFVAYGDTDVFTLGQSMQPVALVFQRVGAAWKLATIVNHSDNGAASWPALCRTGTGATAPVVLAPADYDATLTRALNQAATGAAETPAAAAPLAVNSFFSGPGSFNVQSASQISQDRDGGVTVANRFTAATDPVLALPLAGGRGYWLVGVLVQTCTYGSAAGYGKTTWPDGTSVATARTAAVHHQTDTYITTYTATDPLRSTSGRVALDGFFGWPLTATAS
jgi:hypothetical protein